MLVINSYKRGKWGKCQKIAQYSHDSVHSLLHALFNGTNTLLGLFLSIYFSFLSPLPGTVLSIVYYESNQQKRMCFILVHCD